MRPLRDDPAQATRAAEIVGALAHPDRLRLAAALCEEEAGVLELAASVGLAGAMVSHHLDLLLAARLVAAAPGPGGLRYHVVEPALHGLVACMEKCSR